MGLLGYCPSLRSCLVEGGQKVWSAGTCEGFFPANLFALASGEQNEKPSFPEPDTDKSARPKPSQVPALHTFCPHGNRCAFLLWLRFCAETAGHVWTGASRLKCVRRDVRSASFPADNETKDARSGGKDALRTSLRGDVWGAKRSLFRKAQKQISSAHHQPPARPRVPIIPKRNSAGARSKKVCAKPVTRASVKSG